MVDKVAIGPNGERVIYRSTDNGDWVQVPQKDNVLYNSVYNAMGQKLSENSKNVLADYRLDAVKRREGDLANISNFDKLMIEAGRQATGLGMGALSNTLKAGGFILDGLMGGLSDQYRAGPLLANSNIGTYLYKLATQIGADRANENELTQQFQNEANPAASAAKIVGGSLPYLLTGAFAGPVAKKASGAILDTVSDVAGTIASESKSLLARGSRAAANSDIPVIKDIGKKAVTEYVEPIEQWAARRKLQPPMESPYRSGTAQDLLGGTMLGAAEGATNSDLNAINGAEAGLLGSAAGRLLKYRLENAPLPNNPGYNEKIKALEDIGYVPLPGEVLNNPKLQGNEHAFRTHDKYSAIAQQHDLANQRALNREAFSAMGLQSNGDSLTKEALSDHTTNISRQYQDITSKALVHIDSNDMDNLVNNHVKNLADASSDEGVKAFKVANEYLEKFHSFRQQQARSPIPGVNTGIKWQDLRSEIKKDMNKYAKSDDWRVVDALKPFLSTLDSAVEKGVAGMGGAPGEGAALVARLKDLNEQHAMTSIMLEHGFDGLGNVSPSRLNSYFMSTDPKRYMSGSDGSVSKLHNVASFRPMDRVQAGSSMTGLNEVKAGGGDPKQTEHDMFLSLPAKLMPGALSELYFRLYRSGWPTTKGLLGPGPLPGFNGNDFKNTGLYTRALAQSSQVHPTILNAIGSAADSANEFAHHPVKSIQDSILEFLDRGNKNGR